MGEVFLADDTQLERKVAIKFLTEALEADQTARGRLYREARSAAALDHPYICQIHELADIDGSTGIVMEHVAGETLQARLRRAPLSAKEALEIAGEVAEALEAAHKRRVVYRDLKPSNVMLTAEGHVKVMDFGLAKQAPSSSASRADAETVGALTESGIRMGTPAYMSPEHVLGGQADERSDIFAFGVLLYELLAGVHHVHAREPERDAVSHRARDPKPRRRTSMPHRSSAPPSIAPNASASATESDAPQMQTRAPAARRVRAIARPMFRLPPVTRATSAPRLVDGLMSMTAPRCYQSRLRRIALTSSGLRTSAGASYQSIRPGWPALELPRFRPVRHKRRPLTAADFGRLRERLQTDHPPRPTVASQGICHDVNRKRSTCPRDRGNVSELNWLLVGPGQSGVADV